MTDPPDAYEHSFLVCCMPDTGAMCQLPSPGMPISLFHLLLMSFAMPVMMLCILWGRPGSSCAIETFCPYDCPGVLR